MLTRMNKTGALVVGAIVGWTASATAQEWTSVPTDGLCSAGTPYQFYTRQGTSGDLTVFFNGGGACWFGQQCDLEAEPVTHLPFADMPANNPANFGGLFDLDKAGNPFSDDTIVVLPYCTGDVHVGGGARDYVYSDQSGQEKKLTVQHNGGANAGEVLEWVYANIPTPDRITVTGVSAGGIGASFYAGAIAEHYSSTPVVLIGDAAGGYGSPNLKAAFESWRTAEILPDWPEYAGETAATLSFEDFYIASAQHNPNLTIAQLNSANDATQTQFTYLFGDAPGSFSISERILNNYVEIESGVDAFSTYTASGEAHVILSEELYWTTNDEGVPLSDWVGALVSGQAVDDVSCVNTAEACGTAN